MRDRRLLTAFVAVLVVVFALPALGTSGQITLPFQVQRDHPGTEIVLYDGAMPVVGEECTVVATDAGNNTSVHPDNTLRLETGGNAIIFADIERAPNVSTPGSGTIVPAATGQVVLVLGPEGRYSADLILEFTCVSTATTTTSTTSSSSTPEPTSTSSTTPPTPSTTTDSPTVTTPPVLPFTGLSLFAWASVGGLAVLAGIAAVVSGRDDG